VAAHPWRADGAPPAALRYGPDVALAVGPEGGFTDEEIAEARRAGWQTLDLGPRILRVETAAIVMTVWGGTPVRSEPEA
jgi:16S rRNA (uracil1498-N3)-methyltransferase